MNIKKITDELCVEVYATNNEGTTMTIRKFVEEKGMYKAYLDIHSMLMDMVKNAKWDVRVINVKIYNEDGGL